MSSPPPYEERNFGLTTFDEAVSLRQVDSNNYTANIAKNWSFTPAAHGGYLIAVAQQSVKLHFATTLKRLDQPHTFSIHYEFLLPVAVGEVQVEIKELRVGKGTSTVQFWLRQGKKEQVRGVGFATNCGARAIKNTPSLNLGYTESPARPPISFDAVLNGTDANWIRYDVLRDDKSSNGALSNLVFAMLRNGPRVLTSPTSERRITQQWISPRHPKQSWTNEMLGILFDMSAPIPEAWYKDTAHAVHKMAQRAVENEKEGKSSWDHPAWCVPRFYPTLSMGFEIKRQLPPEGEKWLGLRWHAKDVVDGRWDTDMEIWNTQGHLIATGSALWYLVDANRSLPNSMAKKQKRQEGSKL